MRLRDGSGAMGLRPSTKWLWGAVLLAAALQFAVVEGPLLQQAFGTASWDAAHGAVCVGIASTVLWFEGLRKIFYRSARRNELAAAPRHAAGLPEAAVRWSNDALASLEIGSGSATARRHITRAGAPVQLSSKHCSLAHPDVIATNDRLGGSCHRRAGLSPLEGWVCEALTWTAGEVPAGREVQGFRAG